MERDKLLLTTVLMSFDVKALFTSVPIEPTIKIIKKLLEEDQTLRQRTSMAVNHIVSFLEFCLRSTYFTFKGRYYEQTEGAAMGSPISPIVANLFMEDLESRTIQSAQNPPSFWRRFVDDTLTIMQSSQIDNFLQHLNSLDQTHTIHKRRGQTRWFHAIPRCLDHPQGRWQPGNYCV